MTKFIGINGLKEVSDPVLFERGMVPTTEGLLSTEIFGTTVTDRRDTFAYINLHGHYFHPFIYKMLNRMNRNFESAVNGSKKFIIDPDGQLVVDEEKGQTGVEFLYKNWDKIKFPKNASNIRNERIDVLSSYPKETVFVKYWDVIPAYYRDVNLQNASSGKASHHEINDLYSRLIRQAMLVKDGNMFDFTLVKTQASIQSTLVEIYDLIKTKLEKKNGLIRKSLLGKSIDYGSRSVISAPVFNTERPEDMEVDLYHAGVPLAQCCSLFTPFIVAWVKNYFRREIEKLGNKFPIVDKEGNLKRYVKLKSPELYYNEEYIKRSIDRFVHAPANRFDKIELPIDPDDGYEGKAYLTFVGSYTSTTDSVGEEKTPIVRRAITWTDLLYRAAVDVTKDKMVWITRYPLLDYFGMFPCQVRVMSTKKTMPMFIGNEVHERYPVVDTELEPEQLSVYFIDTLRMSNLYLMGLGGDYDGDQVTIKGVFTQEANIEAKKIMKSKTHILNVNGSNMRTTTNEAIQTLYMLTK